LLISGSKGSILGCKIWAYCVVYGAKYITGVNFVVKGKVPKHPVIFASKHQSAWETAIFHILSPAPCYVLKKELMYIPFFGLYLAVSGQIWIDRSKGTAALKKLITQVNDRTSKGRSVVIFPEGTRTKPGSKPDYKSGIAVLYSKINAPIVPVSLNSGVYWGKNAFIKKPGTITIEFKHALPAGLSKQEFMQELEKQIEA
jgi:1-acyl-sn-glycerol-3-phosphate acyltransferase